MVACLKEILKYKGKCQNKHFLIHFGKVYGQESRILKNIFQVNYAIRLAIQHDL